jgi:hypothetical protein
MTKLSKKVPYQDTQIPIGKSKMDIEDMLKQFGAEALRWTESPESMKGLDCPTLEFIIKTQIKGVEKMIGFRMKAPLLQERRRSKGRYGGPLIRKPNVNASMRLLWWYLKGRLEAVRWGLETIEESLLSHVLVSLPDGRVEEVRDVIMPQLTSQKGVSLLPSFEIKKPPELEST